MRKSKCREYCKWLDYQYEVDEFNRVVEPERFKCDKYDEILGKEPVRCEQCLEESEKNAERRKQRILSEHREDDNAT